MNRNSITLLAPAGSFEALHAAFNAGADAVYFGVGKLNMRSGSSKNFSNNDLEEIAGLAHQKGKKAWLTLNTVMYDEDLELAEKTIRMAASSGVDAIIASDFAIINLCQKYQMPVHISTQSNISNIESVKFFSAYADTMVLARELSLAQVNDITRQIKSQQITGPSGKPVKIEVFVHGALCMAVSGKCYLSLHQQDKSANRGQCRQECRKAYEVTERETGRKLLVDNEYIMSPKDLNTLGFLDQIVDAGVSVLKIEGRARSPEYIQTVTAAYNEALLAIEAGNFNEEKVNRLNKKLESVYHRGFWEGYYLGKKEGEWSEKYGSQATHRKTYIGKVTNYFSDLGVVEIKIESHQLLTGEEIMIMGPTTGLIDHEIAGMRLDDKEIFKAEKGDVVSLKVTNRLRRSDKIYKMVPVG